MVIASNQIQLRGMLLTLLVTLPLARAQTAVLSDTLTIVCNNPTGFSTNQAYLNSITSQIASFYNVPSSYVNPMPGNLQTSQLDVPYKVTVPCSDTAALSNMSNVLINGCCSSIVAMIGKSLRNLGATASAIKRTAGVPAVTGSCVPTATLTDQLRMSVADTTGYATNAAYLNAISNQVATFYKVMQSYVSLSPSSSQSGQVDVNYTVTVPCSEAVPFLTVINTNCCSNLVKVVGQAQLQLNSPITAIKRTAAVPTVTGPCSKFQSASKIPQPASSAFVLGYLTWPILVITFASFSFVL